MRSNPQLPGTMWSRKTQPPAPPDVNFCILSEEILLKLHSWLLCGVTGVLSGLLRQWEAVISSEY